jgi:hypothetical protein
MYGRRASTRRILRILQELKDIHSKNKELKKGQNHFKPVKMG